MNKNYFKKACAFIMCGTIIFNLNTSTSFAAPEITELSLNTQETVEITDYNLETQIEGKSYVKDFILPTNYAQDDETSPYVIIGNDNRTIVSDTTVAPYRYIGRLVIYASSSKTGKAAKFSGTGF